MDGEDIVYDEQPVDIRRLIDACLEARSRAYCPYSQFHVGSAVLTNTGHVVSGSNVENASYGLSVCAERVAIWTAVAAGHTKFRAIAVCCDVAGSYKASCGACRQVIAEFGLDWDVYLVQQDKSCRRLDFRPLLPCAFTPDSLQLDRVPP